MQPSKRQVLTMMAALCLLSLLHAAHSQEQPSTQTEDVIRINTELVQTDLMVFDRQGRFVEDLKPEQFELSVDGKPQTISFFERVRAGSQAEAAQLTAARNPSAKKDVNVVATAGAQDSRRLIFFFLDDVHLSSESLSRARKSLLNYVENQMSPNDQVAIVSTSGQIGFLQQLTDNRAVLEAAIARLNYKRRTEAYAGKTVISEYQANQIVEHGNKDLFNYLVSSTINEFQLVAPKGGDARGLAEAAINNVQNRARQVAAQSRAATIDTLYVLESLLRSSAQLPGRKLVFFMSDGFIADTRGSLALEMLRRITRAASRTGAIVYSMDTRGTFTSSSVDAGRNDFPDGLASGTAAVQPSLETAAMREPLLILANETGGRAILNSNSINDAILRAIKETSDYYLLAWRPDGLEQREGRSRIKVSVKGRPDLSVRLRSNVYIPPPPASVAKTETPAAGKSKGAAVTAAAQQRAPEVELLGALGSLYPHKKLSTTLSAGYVNTTTPGMALRVSMQLERDDFNFAQEGAAQKAEVDVIGAAIDDRGIISTFKQLLTVTHDSEAQKRQVPVIWHQQLMLPPGLYQVRVAVRERGTGRTGSAMQWIEIPDLSKGRLGLSSLFLGERKVGDDADAKGTTAPRAIMVNVDRRFARTSALRFQTYVYNASRGASVPDVWIQAQVLRDNRQVVALPANKVPTDGNVDLARLPYWAEVGLSQLPAGRYVLQVTATDRITQQTASQHINFVIE